MPPVPEAARPAPPAHPFRHCPACGTQLIARPEGGRDRPCCPACGHVVYGRFSLGVGGLLWHAGRVLVVQRAHDPGKGRWTLPGGYVEEDEPPDRAVEREVAEETGLRVRAAGLLAIRHAQGPDNQNAYYVFELALDGPLADLRAGGDGVEIARCLFVQRDELDRLGEVGAISRWAIDRYQPGDAALRPVPPAQLPPPVPNHRWTALYAGPSASAAGGQRPTPPCPAPADARTP
jgi:ADP-ribose pyrophosphatase YjhB (NUDIX family)